ncbi:DUF3592 domain-containing protein [Saccharopolyspora indica]|uniref:DUF3592 domain-containing protein n=1 Tax=Saccharopolyspora indica TaxID=1229659 RepID=UPI0022EA2F38|nr:DUF3592 domain-containing protein [Saccharopolyspora indica]MDA3649761.1 hypothetical protein [Saccharopolyspora indica]
MASDAVVPNAADSVTGSSTEGDRPVARPVRRKGWRRAARGVLVLGVLMTAMGLSIIIACFINDRTIEESRGEAVAEVVDTSLFRTAVRFNTDEGRVYIPANGVLYPTDLQTGQLVRVEFDSRNPDLVRVAGRNATLSFLPVGSMLAVLWAILLPLYWLFRRNATR